MRLGFATKLRLALLWPALAALAVAVLLLAWLLPRRFERSAASELLETTGLFAPVVAEHLAAGPQPLQAWVRGLAGSSDLRLTVIGGDGLVLADSSRTDEQLRRMDNHSTRPEVRQALANGSGTSVRRSATTGVTYAYAARMIALPGRGVIVVRLAEPVHSLAIFEAHLGTTVALAVLAALVAVAAVSWWVGRRLFMPLAGLVAGAERFAGGELGYRVTLPEEPELAALGAALNRLAEHAEAQVGAAERERDQLRSILASMAEGVLVTDARGRALLANPAFARLFATRAGVAGKLPIEVTREPALQELVSATLASGSPGSADLLVERGERRHLALLASPLGGGGGVVVVARDVTPFVRLNEMRRDFVANVSH
ncbi:MAG TPA: PAS domain-containing protein, partial [Thermoanaerobaculia bacterium]|nr:PAS domain-containing protein [Thermoanaerobaculia bacterium]